METRGWQWRLPTEWWWLWLLCFPSSSFALLKFLPSFPLAAAAFFLCLFPWLFTNSFPSLSSSSLQPSALVFLFFLFFPCQSSFLPPPCRSSYFSGSFLLFFKPKPLSVLPTSHSQMKPSSFFFPDFRSPLLCFFLSFSLLPFFSFFFALYSFPLASPEPVSSSLLLFNSAPQKSPFWLAAVLPFKGTSQD